MAYSDPYEEWKAQGRPGGDFEAWKAAQAPAEAPPPPPAPAPGAPAPGAPPAAPGPPPPAYQPPQMPPPQAPPAAPQQAPFQPTTEQQRVAQMPPGSFPDDSADAGKANTGDPYLDELRSGRFAGSEDWRRFSNAELKNMQKYYVGNGKFKNKYGDIVDKPDDTGPNTPAGYNGTGDYIGGGAGPGGGGGAGPWGGGGGKPGAGGGGKPEGAPGQPGDMAGASDTVWQAILERLKGGTRFTPEVMEKLLSGTKTRAEAGAARGIEESNRAMQRRGILRSNIAAEAERDIRSQAQGQVLQADVQLQKAKVDADFQDRTQAISDGINWLNSLRTYTANMAATKAQKDVAMANIALGYKQLQQQQDMLREKYQQDLSMLGLGM